jgi:hypothetical protein
MEDLIQQMYTDKALAQDFLEGNQQRVEEILNAFGMYFPGGTLTRLEWLDNIKKRVENHQKFSLINSDTFTSAVDDTIANYQDTNLKTINVLKETKEIDDQVALALQLINTQYVLGLQEMEIATEQVKQLKENNNVNGQALFRLWTDSHGSTYKTISQFENDAENSVSGDGTKFNSASNQDQNEGFVSIEQVLTDLELVINNKLLDFDNFGESTIQDIDQLVAGLEENFSSMERSIFDSAKAILFEKSGGKQPTDGEVRSHPEYIREMEILNSKKTLILDTISAKKEEVQNRINERNENLKQEEKFNTGNSFDSGRFQSREDIRKFVKDNDLGDMTIQDIFDRFEISNSLKRGLNNQIKSGNLSLTDSI